jgi:2-keto-4-pentenoate hydratase
MTATDVRSMADDLFAAERDRRQIAPLSSRAPISPQDAYAIQLANVERRIKAGERVVGKKVGLTAKVIQQMLKVDQPDYGHLFEVMEVADNAKCAVSGLLQPRVEPEIAIVLAKSLRGPGLTDLDILAATEAVVPAIEIVDSRIENWKITFADTVADNGSAARFVLGKRRTPPTAIDLRTAGTILSKNGQVTGTGAGAAVLGANPFRAVAWLANTLAGAGLELAAGDVILPGALCGMVSVAAGDTVSADFGPLGTVTVHFN